jgi:hypothetical protein
MAAKLKHWGKKQRTEDEAKLAATAAATPLVKKKTSRWQASAGGQDKRCEGRLH